MKQKFCILFSIFMCLISIKVFFTRQHKNKDEFEKRKCSIFKAYAVIILSILWYLSGVSITSLQSGFRLNYFYSTGKMLHYEKEALLNTGNFLKD
jgi:hypothetical protein